jgi:hypothetical protein
MKTITIGHTLTGVAVRKCDLDRIEATTGKVPIPSRTGNRRSLETAAGLRDIPA